MLNELSGAKFKQIYGNIFYKILKNDLNHNNLQLKNGENIDINNFNPSGQCTKGGIYFTNLENIYYFLHLGVNVCKVTINDDYRVYVDNSHNQLKFKADKIIINDIQLLFNSYLFNNEINCKIAVQKNGLLLKYINSDNQSNDICKFAIIQNYNALKYVYNQTEEICKLAIQQNYNTSNSIAQYNFNFKNDYSILNDVRNQTIEICKFAIYYNYRALKYVHIQTNEICKFAIEINYNALKYVKKQTNEICIFAILIDYNALKCVHFQTNEICKFAIEINYNALKYVRKQTRELCNLAIKQNSNAIKYVKNKFKKIE